MKARDIARMEAGTRTFSFNIDAENSVKLATIEDYPAVALGISDTLKEIKSAHSAQSKDISGIAPTKQELRVEMGETILIFSQRGMVSATLAGNKELSEEIDHSLLYYTKGKGSLSESRATATVDLIELKLLKLASITAANVVTMRAAIAAFVAKKDEPTIEKQAKKVDGTDQVAPLLDKLDRYITLEGNLIHSYFPKSKLSEGFDLTSKLIILGGRHNPIDMYIEDALSGKFISGIKVSKVKNLKLFNFSDDDGLAHFDTCTCGKQKFLVEAVGYVAQTVTLIVVRGSGAEVIVKMVTK
ncbi:MAG: hypothetical protein WCP65_01485 [Bacteroidota bacterium]